MPTTDSDEVLIPIGKAATILGVSVDTVRRWERAGAITARRTLGGQRRFVLADVMQMKSAS